MSGHEDPEVFRPSADAYPIFIQLECVGEEYQLWAQQIVESADGFDAARAALHERAKSLLRSHECNAESYTCSWVIFDRPVAVKWARHLFGVHGAESFVLARPTGARAGEVTAPLAASPGPYMPPVPLAASDLENPHLRSSAAVWRMRSSRARWA